MEKSILFPPSWTVRKSNMRCAQKNVRKIFGLCVIVEKILEQYDILFTFDAIVFKKTICHHIQLLSIFRSHTAAVWVYP